MEQQLIEFMKRVINGMDTTVDFMNAQLPDYIYQLLIWNMLEKILFGFFFLFLASLVFFYGHKVRFTYKNGKVNQLWKGEIFAVGYVILPVVSLIFFSSSLRWFKESLQVYLAPKVWLVEYVASLIK